jgi:protein-tyrosine phosphatase
MYRSGALNDISDKDDLPKVRAIVNLTRGNDPGFVDIRLLQVAPRDTMNNYIFTSEVFQEWIQRLYNTLADDTIWPLLMHCGAGKDRTGVGIALLLKNLGVSDNAIVKEYMRSEGNRYPESMECLLRTMPDIGYLRMKESQIQVLKSKVLLGLGWVEELGFEEHQDFVNCGPALLSTYLEERDHERQRALCPDSWAQ